MARKTLFIAVESEHSAMSTCIGAQAAEFLIDRIENPRTAGSETATIPVKLLEGESMGICPVKADAANS